MEGFDQCCCLVWAWTIVAVIAVVMMVVGLVSVTTMVATTEAAAKFSSMDVSDAWASVATVEVANWVVWEGVQISIVSVEVLLDVVGSMHQALVIPLARCVSKVLEVFLESIRVIPQGVVESFGLRHETSSVSLKNVKECLPSDFVVCDKLSSSVGKAFGKLLPDLPDVGEEAFLLLNGLPEKGFDIIAVVVALIASNESIQSIDESSPVVVLELLDVLVELP